MSSSRKAFENGVLAIALAFAASVLAWRQDAADHPPRAWAGAQPTDAQRSVPTARLDATWSGPAAGDTPFFQEVVGAIPSLKPIYDQYALPMQVRPIAVDLDGDGRDDLLLHMYFVEIGAPGSTTPCRNRLVALVQQANGSFVDQTANRIAGSTDLQACSSDFVVADVNGDGRDDVVFANSQEDGRQLADSAYANALTAALVSRPDGRHGVERFGAGAWHYGVVLPRDANGQRYVVVSSYNHAPEAYRRNAATGLWEAYDVGTPHTEANMSVFHRADGGTGPSTQLIRNAAYPNNFDIGGAVLVNGTWQDTPDLRLFDYPGTVKLKTWSGVINDTPVVDIGGEYALAGTFLRGCAFRASPGAPVQVVSKLQAGIMPVAYAGPDQLVDENSTIKYDKVERFQIVGGKVVHVPLEIAGERNRQVQAEYHRCGDLNGDGYDDVVVHQEGPTGAPLVYLNNRHGGLRYIGSEPFPVPPVDWGSSGISLLHDFDHDGRVDYLSCPCNLRSSEFNNDLTFHFYRGVAPLPETSVPGVPRSAMAQAGVASARVAFDAPRDDGGLPLTGYTVQSIPAGGVDADAGSLAREHLVTGLANGTAYRFTVVAQNAKGAGNASVASNAVTPLPQTVSIASVDAVEGQAGTSFANFVVSLSSAASQPVTVDVATVDGRALAGVDYGSTAVNGLTIPAGQLSANVQVPIHGDTVVEAHEVFWVQLSNPVGANLGAARARGRILNDDLAALSVADASLVEGDAGQRTLSFRITLSQPMPSPVTFDIATQGQGAMSGVDFQPRSQTARLIDPGRTSAVFEVAIVGDTQNEADETLWAVLSNVQGATVARAIGNGTILNDDAPPAKSGVLARWFSRMAPGDWLRSRPAR